MEPTNGAAAVNSPDQNGFTIGPPPASQATAQPAPQTAQSPTPDANGFSIGPPPPQPVTASATMSYTAPGAPTQTTPTAQQPTQANQPSFGSRLVDSNPLKGKLDAPIDMISDMNDSLAAGNYKNALKQAYSAFSILNPQDPQNPLAKAAYNTIVSLSQKVHDAARKAEDTFHKDRQAGHGVVASTIDAATGANDKVTTLGNTLGRAKQDIASGNTAGAVGDAITGANQLVPMVGDAVGPALTNVDTDLHNHNYGAVSGDVVGGIANLLPLLSGSKATGLDDALTAATPDEQLFGTRAGAGTSATPNRFTRAVETVRKAQRTAAQAPGDVQATKSFTRAVADAHQAALDQVNENFANAHGQVNADHEAVTASHQEALDKVNQTFADAHKQISAQHMGTTAEHQAALAQSEFMGHQAEQGAQALAQTAPEDFAITESARNATNTANKQMHTNYVASADKLQKLTKDAAIPFDGSNTHQAALELTGKGAAEGPVTQAVSQSLPGGPQANKILNNLTDTAANESKAATPLVGEDGVPLSPEQQSAALAAHGMDADVGDETLLDNKPAAEIKMPDLMKAYQKLGENSRKVGWATSSDIADQDIYNRLKKGVIDDIAQLADKSGNPEAVQIAEKMNTDYRENVRLYQNPAVKALREGKLSDVDARLTGKQASPGDIATFKKILGEEGFNKFADGSLRRLFADAIKPDGTPDWGKALTKLGGMDSEVRQALYGDLGESALETLTNVQKAAEQTKAAQEGLAEADKTKDAALKGIGNTAKGKAQEINEAQATTDEAKATALKGIGDTAAGQTKEISDAIAHMIGDGNISNLISDPGRLDRFAKAVGPKGVKDFGNMWIDNQIRNASLVRKGADFVPARFDPDKFLEAYTKVFEKNPDGVNVLFKPDATTAARFDKFMKNMENASSVKTLVKNGLIRTSLGAVGSAVGSFYGPFEAAMVGILAAGGTDVALGRAKSFVDALANHPAMWKVVDKIGKVGKVAGAPMRATVDAARATGGAAKATAKAAKMVFESNPMITDEFNRAAPAAARRVAAAAAYAGSKDSLSGNDKR